MCVRYGIKSITRDTHRRDSLTHGSYAGVDFLSLYEKSYAGVDFNIFHFTTQKWIFTKFL
jgi:hypothetical protein